MIEKFIVRFEANKPQLQNYFKTEGHPKSYKQLVEAVIKLITSDDYGDIDPERIHQIDDGDYQGTLLYIIAEKGYQPSNYWSVFVGYGSCSGCDTLQSIESESRYDEPITDNQIEQYMTLALHIVQGLKSMNGQE